MSGCGSNNGSNTTSNTPALTVSVSPSTASVTTGATQQFTATVTNATNTAVTWQVNGVAGGNATVGTISSGGLYTAPASVPAPATVTVTAVSQADSSKTATASVTVTAPASITIAVTPPSPSVAVNATQQFTATVTGTTNTSVTWQVNNVAGGNSTVGTISASGLYTAPTAVPSPATVTIKAVSAADATKTATATATITTATSSTSRFVYVSSYPDNKLAVFSVDDTTGLLNPTSTANTGTSPSFVAMHPSGKFVYALNTGSNDISIFTVNTGTGALTSAGTAATSAGPFYMAFTSDGKFAYVTCDTAHAIAAFSVNTSTGALTAITGSPYTVSTGRVRALAITPDNKYLYTADRDVTGSGIFGYTINGTTGALTKMPSAFSGDNIGTLIVDKAGKFVYAGSPDDVVVSGYSLNASTGALTFINDYQASLSNVSVWTFDPTGTYLYGGSTSANKAFGFKQNTDGSLTAISGMPVSTAVFPNGGGLHPNGKFAYVVSTISDTSLTPGTITIYSVSSTTGAWTQINSTPAGVNNTIGFAITP